MPIKRMPSQLRLTRTSWYVGIISHVKKAGYYTWRHKGDAYGQRRGLWSARGQGWRTQKSLRPKEETRKHTWSRANLAVSTPRWICEEQPAVDHLLVHFIPESWLKYGWPPTIQLQECTVGTFFTTSLLKMLLLFPWIILKFLITVNQLINEKHWFTIEVCSMSIYTSKCSMMYYLNSLPCQVELN